MSLNRKVVENNEKRSSIPRLEEGTYLARIVQVIDLGTQEIEDFKTGKKTGERGKVHITWEFPTETVEINGEEKPRWYGRTYTLSFNEMSALYKLLNNLKLLKVENLSEIINTPCMVTIGSTANGNAKIETVAGVPKGMEVPELVNNSTFFDFDDPSKEAWNSLPNFLQEEIKKSVDYPGSVVQELVEGDEKETEQQGEEEEELPFDDE